MDTAGTFEFEGRKHIRASPYVGMIVAYFGDIDNTYYSPGIITNVLDSGLLGLTIFTPNGFQMKYKVSHLTETNRRFVWVTIQAARDILEERGVSEK